MRCLNTRLPFYGGLTELPPTQHQTVATRGKIYDYLSLFRFRHPGKESIIKGDKLSLFRCSPPSLIPLICLYYQEVNSNQRKQYFGQQFFSSQLLVFDQLLQLFGLKKSYANGLQPDSDVLLNRKGHRTTLAQNNTHHIPK